MKYRVWSLPMTQELSDPNEIVSELDISHLTIEDGTPVDSILSEKQQRLLVEPLYSSKPIPSPFLAATNVGLFYALRGEPVVPDMMLSLGVQCAEDLSQKKNQAYFVWEFGKVPEICIEVVSNTEGDEISLSRKSEQEGKTTAKKDLYARIRIPYYVVFDPLRQIQGEREMDGALLRVWATSGVRYTDMTATQGINDVGQSVWLEDVGLGLTLWSGQFEGITRVWLRWCDYEGRVIPTGVERIDIVRQERENKRQQTEAEGLRAETEQQRVERLAERLRAMGVNPDDI